ncbi:hypothetical protein N2152v2_007069 [Parachlorella kessleri]
MQAALFQPRRRRKHDDGFLLRPWEGLRQTASGTEGAFVTKREPSPASNPAEDTTDGPERLAKVVAGAFSKQPRATALAILKHLSELDRVHLLLAIQQSTNKNLLARQDTAYVDTLMKQRRSFEHHQGLTRSQIANAVEYQRMLQKFSSYSVDQPRPGQLLAVAIASGLPFVGFGFVDNLVMLVAGEQIDLAFGTRLGISTLASAALGNLVADVVGVSVTHQIQSAVQHIKWAQPPRLSVLQQSLFRVKAAKLGGAVLGVSIGCILGMSPLFFMEAPDRPERPAPQTAQESAAPS